MYKSFFMFVALLCTVVQGMWAQTGVNTEEALTAAVASGGSTTASRRATWKPAAPKPLC